MNYQFLRKGWFLWCAEQDEGQEEFIDLGEQQQIVCRENYLVSTQPGKWLLSQKVWL